MEGKPVWFGSAARPLLGWYHCPDGGGARATAVICPPIGRDHLQAYYALRMLGEELADRGIAAFRFDYDGTGDSAGTDLDPARVPSWLGSIRAAVELVRATGATTITLVGMRLGATLAGCFAEGHPVDGLVLWDPVTSGRDYLVEQAALNAISAPSSRRPTDGSAEAPGMIFTPETVLDLRNLDLAATTGDLARRVAVLVRPDRSASRLIRRLTSPGVEWMEAMGQDRLMDFGGEDQSLPLSAIASVAEWISAGSPPERQILNPPPPAGPTTVETSPSGAAVVETPVYVGPAGLFGIMCEPSSGGRGAAVLFLSVANEHRMGPARLWTELSRRWAAHGMRCLRLDMSSLGDSPLRHPEQPRFLPRGPEAFDDVLDAARFLSPDDPSNVVLVGLCSSAYQALESSFELVPRGVISIQADLSFQPAEVLAGKPIDPRRRVVIPLTPVARAFSKEGPLSGLRRRFPDLGWRLRLWIKAGQRPGRWLRRLNRMGVDVLLVCGEWEGRPIRLGASRRLLDRLHRTGRFRFEYQPELAHGLLVAEQRLEVVELLAEHVTRHFLPKPGEPGNASGERIPVPVPDDPDLSGINPYPIPL